MNFSAALLLYGLVRTMRINSILEIGGGIQTYSAKNFIQV